MASRRFGGDFMAKTDTRSDATAEALRLMVEEVARLRRERVSRRELQNAQAYLAGSFPLTIETPDQPVGPEGSRALAENCRQAVGDLQRLLSALPVDLLNWSDTAKRQGGRHP